MAGQGKLRPGKPPARNGEQKRARIASEAARIMAEEGVKDFQMAKRKATARLNITERHNLPTNEEIDHALSERLQLFHGSALARNVQQLRQVAFDAMNFLAAFEPRLVGPVLTGKVTATSEIQLHLSADTPEQVALFLQEHRVPYRLSQRRVKFGGDRHRDIATYDFTADGVSVVLYVFDPRASREIPLSPVDGRPIERGNIRRVGALLAR